MNFPTSHALHAATTSLLDKLINLQAAVEATHGAAVANKLPGYIQFNGLQAALQSLGADQSTHHKAALELAVEMKSAQHLAADNAAFLDNFYIVVFETPDDKKPRIVFMKKEGNTFYLPPSQDGSNALSKDSSHSVLLIPALSDFLFYAIGGSHISAVLPPQAQPDHENAMPNAQTPNSTC